MNLSLARILRRSITLAAATAVVAGLAGLAGCGSSNPSAASSPLPGSVGSAASTSPTFGAVVPDPTEPPGRIGGVFSVGPDRRRLALACWGSGQPVVVLDAGSLDAGIARWRTSAVVKELATRTTVCAYDRAGLGDSDPAPRRPRVLDDVARDLHSLLAAAKVARPVVMVGASGGGFDVYQHAGRYPADVAGLVLLDVPQGQRSMSHADGPPAWNDDDNPEHVDFYAEEHQMAVARLPIRAIPVTVVTAAAGESEDPATQKLWLAGSSRPVQVVLDGGHDIAYDNPDAVVKEILAVVTVVAATS